MAKVCRKCNQSEYRCDCTTPNFYEPDALDDFLGVIDRMEDKYGIDITEEESNYE
jgi:hypothetical protein